MFKFCELKQNAVVQDVSFLTWNQDVKKRIDAYRAVDWCGGLGTVKMVLLENYDISSAASPAPIHVL